MREAVWEEECRRQREEARWQLEMKRQEERRRRMEEEEEDEVLRPKQEQAQPPPHPLLMPRLGASLDRDQGRIEDKEDRQTIFSSLETKEGDLGVSSISMVEDGNKLKDQEAKVSEEVEEERRRRAVSVDESPPGGNYASGGHIGGQRLRVGVSLDDQRANVVKDNSRAALIPVSIGVDQRDLVVAPGGELEDNHWGSRNHQEMHSSAANLQHRSKELMKSIDDEDKERLHDKNKDIKENTEPPMRKSSHSRSGERRKSGQRAESEEKRKRDSSEGKKTSRSSRSQSSDRVLEGNKAHKERKVSSESRSASSERILKQLERLGPSVAREPVQGIYVGEYQNQSWVFVGEITSVPREVTSPLERRPLQRSASQESTASEKDFSKAYQAITHRMVHRKSSAIMYSRILERTFECNKTVLVQRVGGEFGFRIHGSRPVVVSAIEHGTPAMSSGLSVGDILLTINGVNVLDLPHTQVVRVAQKCTEALELGVASTCSAEGKVPDRPCVWEQLSLSKEVLAQGRLMKRKRVAGSGHQWVGRWFLLRADHCLYSFKSDQEQRPSGALLLPGCRVEERELGEEEEEGEQVK